MELILGLPPMTQFDAAANPMYASFGKACDPKPILPKPRKWICTRQNSPLAWGADLSEQLDLSREDAADDLLLGEIVWRSVRGPNSKMPPPVRAAFVFVNDEEDDDEEEDDDDDSEEHDADDNTSA